MSSLHSILTTDTAELKTASEPLRRRNGRRGFTLIEVMIAGVVLVLGILVAMTVMQSGLQAVGNARNYTTAAQLMQNEMERLRLKSWSQLQTMQDAHDTAVPLNTAATSHGAPFVCTRNIRDLKPDMKEIEIVSSWHSYDGQPHVARLVSRYSKTGLYDYLYTAH